MEGWPRGGAKSTTAELGVAFIGARLSRRYVLYVSGTQDQADKHVQSIATLFEKIGIDRSLNKYGNSKGWRRNQLRTSTGFNIEAIGLDVAARGIRLDEFRPDLIVFDDIDGLEDTSATTAKKIGAITKSIIPAGSTNCAVLFIQNLIIPDGVMAQLVDGRADFLMEREVHVEPAVRGLRVELEPIGDRNRWKVLSGEPTWEGQNLAICQKQINDWGLRAFLQESQHEVKGAQGYFFDESQFRLVDSVDDIVQVCRAWDKAATQGAGDYTVGVLMGKCRSGRMVILDVVRAQLSPDNVSVLMDEVTRWDKSVWGSKYHVRVPQDPGSAGKAVAIQDKRTLGAVAAPVTGKKAKRAEKYAEEVNKGNVDVLRDNRPRTARIDALLDEWTRSTALEGKTHLWNYEFLQEHRQFREDEGHKHDDQVDAAADAFNDLMKPQPPAPKRTSIGFV